MPRPRWWFASCSLLFTGSTGTAEVPGVGGRKAWTCSTVPSGMSRRSAGAPRQRTIPVGQQGEGVRIVHVKLARSLHVNAAAAVDVIPIRHELATLSPAPAAELAGFGAERFVGGVCGDREQEKPHAQWHEPSLQCQGSNAWEWWNAEVSDKTFSTG